MKQTVQKNCSLLEGLQDLYPDSSKRTLRSFLKNKRVQVNQTTIQKSSYPLQPSDVLEIVDKEQVIANGVKIIFDCPNYLIIEKPSNLLSTPLDTKPSINAFDTLKDHYYPERIYPAHRLDFEASGLLLFCKKKENQILFKELFSKHLITRDYVAIVEGLVPTSEGIIESYLKELPNLKVVSSQDGKLAVTFYERVQKRKKTTCLLLKLKTGRKHQIRVHLSDLGYPILGDKRYGAQSKFKKRIALHAYHLAFQDPITNKQMEFFSSVPKEFSVDNSLLGYPNKNERSMEKKAN